MKVNYDKYTFATNSKATTKTAKSYYKSTKEETKNSKLILKKAKKKKNNGQMRPGSIRAESLSCIVQLSRQMGIQYKWLGGW